MNISQRLIRPETDGRSTKRLKRLMYISLIIGFGSLIFANIFTVWLFWR